MQRDPLGSQVRLGNLRSALGAGSGLVLGVLALAGVWVVVAGGYKQLWRDLAADVQRAAAFGQPILVVRPVTATLIDVYAPHALDKMIPTLNGRPPASSAPDDLIWFAYHDSPKFAPFHEQLATLGYQRVLHQYYERPLYLDLYVGPNAQPGRVLDLNGQFAGGVADAAGWQLPLSGSVLEPASSGGRQLLLQGADPAQTARQSIPARPGALYLLTVNGQAALQGDGQATAHLACRAADGSALTANAPTAPLPNDGQWHPLKVAALCPPVTTRLEVALEVSGSGTAHFQEGILTEALPPLH